MRTDVKKLIEWCWNNLSFDNDPETWRNTYIIDILNGYNGDCHGKDGKAYRYQEIRNMFRKKDPDLVVIAKNIDGTFYLTPALEFVDGISDGCIWEGSLWDYNTVKYEVEPDAKIHGYTYTIEELDA